MSNSLYAQYIAERENKNIIETDYGFATYRFNKDKSVYIEEVYVKPEFRKQGYASLFVNEIVERSHEQGCNLVITTACPSANNSTDSVKAILAYGFKIKSSINDLIIFELELE